MGEQTFTRCLLKEMESARDAVLSLLITRDELLYVKAPALRSEYMDCIGEYEQQVLEAELEMTLLQKKLALIRAKCNRREAINSEELEGQIAADREKLIAEAEKTDLTRDEMPQLTEEEQQTLQTDYHMIVRAFHPETHTDLTQTERELYEKACDAYKRQDVQSMEIIRDALLPSEEELQMLLKLSLSASPQDDETERMEAERRSLNAYSTDYSLASKLFQSYEPSPEECALIAKTERFKEQRMEVEQEISAIKASFQFI